MSVDLASLFIKVDSSGVVTASKNLDDFAGKAGRAEGSTRNVEKATASAMSSFTRLAGAIGVGALAYQALMRVMSEVNQLFQKGFQAVDDYKTSIASLAAMVTTFSKMKPGQDLASQWEEALAYSQEMIPILENIAAKTLLSGKETTALAKAFARSGVFLDATNAKQIESFTRLSNALPLMTQGQDIMMQINQEIRGLMNGGNVANSMLLQTLKSIDKEIEKHLVKWREEGTVLEHIGDLLVGFGPATSILENGWQAVKSTMDTIVTQVLRGGMMPVYEDIINATKTIGDFLNEHKQTISGGITIAWETVLNIVGAVWGVLKGFGPMLKDMGAAVGYIAYGWGIVFAALKPVGETIGKLIGYTYELIKMLYNAGRAAGNITAGVASFDPEHRKAAFKAAGEAWNQAKANYAEASRLGNEITKSVTSGVTNSVNKYLSTVDKASKASTGLGKAHKYTFDSIGGAAEEAGKKAKKALSEAEKAAKAAAREYEQLAKRAQEFIDKSKEEGELSQFEGLRKALRENELEYDKTIKQYADLKGALKEELEAEALATKQRKDTQAVEEETQKQRELAVKAAKELSETERVTDEARLEALEKIRAAQELSLTAQEKELDLAELQGRLHKDTLNDRLRIANELIAMHKKTLDEMNKEADEAAWYAQYDKWVAAMEKGLKLQEEIRKQTGSFFDGWKEGWKKWTDELLTAFDVGEQEAQATATGMSSAFSNIFFDGVKGDLHSLADYFEDMLDSMLRILTDYLAQMLTQWLMTTSKMTLSDVGDSFSNALSGNNSGGGILDTVKNWFTGDNNNTSTIWDLGKSAYKYITGTGSASTLAANGGYYAAALGGLEGAASTGAGYFSSGSMFATSAALDTAAIPTLDVGTGVYATALKSNAAGQAAGATLGGTLGAAGLGYLGGGYLAKALKLNEQNGSIGGGIGAGIGYAVGASSAVSGTALGASLGSWAGPVGAVVGALAGTLLGGLIGKGKTNKVYESGVGVTFTNENQDYLDYVNSSLAARPKNSKVFQNLVGDMQGGLPTSTATIRDLLEGSGSAWGYNFTRAKINGNRRVPATYSEQFAGAMQETFVNISNSMLGYAEELGVNTENVLNYRLQSFRISTSGKTAEETKQLLADKITEITNQMVSDLFGAAISQYQAEGETLVQTATRLIADKKVVAEIMEMTNKHFPTVAADAVALSESLIALEGSLENLQTAAETYYDKFFSNAEKFTRIKSTLEEALEGLDFTLPKYRSGYRDLVEAADLTTDAGKKAYTVLLNLAGLADQYYSTMEAAVSEIVSKLVSARDAMKINSGEQNQQSFISQRDQLFKVLAETESGNTSNVTGLQLDALTQDFAKYFSTEAEYKAEFYKIGNALDKIAVITSQIGIVPGYATGGTFGGGWRVVGENGPELEYTGPSIIYSNNDSRKIIDMVAKLNNADFFAEGTGASFPTISPAPQIIVSPQSNNAPSDNKNKELLTEIKGLRTDLRAQGFSVSQNLSKQTSIMKRWDGDGLPGTRSGETVVVEPDTGSIWPAS